MPFDQFESRSVQSVGSKLRNARVARKLTQSDLARPDFSVSYISAIERGQIHPSLRALEIFAQRLGISSSDLLSKPTFAANETSLMAGSEQNNEVIELELLEAQLFIRQGASTQAIRQLEILSYQTLMPQQAIHLHYLLGWAYYNLDLFEDSESALAEALKFVDDPNDFYRVLILNLLGMVHASMHNYAQGLEYQLVCLDLLEKDQQRYNQFFVAQVYTNIGMHYTFLDKVAEAEQMFKRALSFTKELRIPDQRSLMYWNASRYFAETHKYLYAMLNGQKSLQICLQEYSNSLESEIYHYLGQALLQGDRQGTLVYLENLLQTVPVKQNKLTLASVTTTLADLLLRQGVVEKANEHAQEAYELALPYGDSIITANTLIVLGRIAYAQKDYKDGDSHFVAGLGMLERLDFLEEFANQSAYYAQLLESREMPNEALKYYKKAFESRRESTEIPSGPSIEKNKEHWLARGSALYSIEHYEDALTAFDRALSLDPKNVIAYREIGMTLRSLKRYHEALAAFDQALTLDPTDAITYYNKGDMLYELDRYDEALIAINQALTLDSNYAAAYYSKGMILQNLKRYQEALVAFERAIQIAPGLAPDLEPEDTKESSRSLLVRIAIVQQFLVEAGFDFTAIPNSNGFLAVSRTRYWEERFPRGLYVRIMFDDPLDRRTVQSIYEEAKEYSDHALVVINRQPEISGWGEINLLRGEEKDYRFVCLPIAESLIKENTALNKELQTLRFYINQRLGKDFDPYDVRDPVSGAVSFFGRQSLTEEILSALRRGQRLGLFGIHKMGKSSVLQELQKRAEFPVAYIYLRTSDNLQGIYKRILQDWSINSRIKYPNFKWTIPSSIDTDPKIIFESLAKDLLTQLGRVSDTPLLAVFLDEIEHIVPYKKDDEKTLSLYVNLMDSLRGLQQETGSLSLLVAGIHPDMARRNYFWGNQKNPMHQIISEKFLLPLDKEDCSYMIRSLGQQVNLAYDEDALDYILLASGAHPFLARQICSLVYKKRRDISTISKEMIQITAQDFVKNPSTASYFDDHGLWGELGNHTIWGEDVSDANHQILCSLAASTGELSESEIYSGLNRKTAEQSLNALKERGIISSSKSFECYHITFGLFRIWIRLHKLYLED